jgi:hypothetical protein
MRLKDLKQLDTAGKLEFLTVIVSILAVIFTVYAYFSIPIIEFTSLGIHLNTSTQEHKSQAKNVSLDTVGSLKLEIDEIKYKLNNLSANASKKDNFSITYSNIDIVKLGDEYKSLDKRISNIENVIMNSPERALELYILKQELDNLKYDIEEERANTEREIDRLYDFTKWFLVLMFTMAISMMGLALSHLIKKPKPPTKKKS